MSDIDIKLPEGARKLTPLEMNKLAILKAHTVITFSDPAAPHTSPQTNKHS
ncbi:MAG: hypothetical protein K2I92_04105 [Muribaculaceae bacterium]|nr:hypothetical protein [Muribaculaceae bacterium]